MRTIIQIISLVTAICFISGCTPGPITPPKTQLQLREFQSRTYTGKDLKMVMKAVINALQDEGFIVKSADKELGFISASKEVDVSSSGEKLFAVLLSGSAARYSQNAVIESSANLTEFGKEVRLRMIFQRKILDNFGNPIKAEQVDDEKFYQDFFAKVDKSVFIEKQGV